MGSCSSNPVDNVSSWDASVVAAWFASKSPALGQYKEAFIRAEVDGGMLCLLTEEMLESEVGIPSKLHRAKILQLIDSLGLRAPPGVASAAPKTDRAPSSANVTLPSELPIRTEREPSRLQSSTVRTVSDSKAPVPNTSNPQAKDESSISSGPPTDSSMQSASLSAKALPAVIETYDNSKGALVASSTSSFGFSLVRGNFEDEHIQPFPQVSLSGSSEFIFFLSHRGPDTKDVLVRPLSFLLTRLGLPHFFDQSDDSMQLGKINSEQMAQAAWSCHLGVVFISDHFAESKWCLRELNTFLLRRHLDPNKAVLLPVYYSEHLLTQSNVFKPHIGHFSAIIRKNYEAAHEFLVSLLPRLLTAPEIQSLPAVIKAQKELAEDSFFVRRLWNEFVESSVEKVSHHKFIDPNPGRAELEHIKSLHKNLIPNDIKAGLEVYQPLDYSLSPPSSVSDRYCLETVVLELLENKKIVLGGSKSDSLQPALSTQDEKQVPTTIRRGSTLKTFTPLPLQVLLIQGAAGSGKSLFGWHLCNRYYSSASRFLAAPLFVSLPLFRHVLFSKSAHDPSQLLPTYFSETFGLKNLAGLQQQPLVIILDGLDELGSKLNLFKECHLHLWTKTVFIITCRSEFLQESDIPQYITPTNRLDGKLSYDRLGKLYLLPFSSSQRSEYVAKFARRYYSVYGWEAQQYLSTLDGVPQLGAFLHEPLLLFMVLSVLPRFHFGVSSSDAIDKTTLRRFDPCFLEVQPVCDIKWVFPQIRRAELYALFVTGWAEREIARFPAHADGSKPTVEQVLDFCSQLAFEMFLKSQTSVVVAQDNNGTTVCAENSKWSSRANRAKQLQRESSSSHVDQWAINLFADHQDERACSPLRRAASGHYSFLHKSLQEFFTALHVAGELTEKVLLDRSGSWQLQLQSNSISKLLISKKRVISDYAVIRFASDLVDQRVKSYNPSSLRPDDQELKTPTTPVEEFQPFGCALFDILHANRHPIACANVMTILNAAGVSFGNRNFFGLDLSSDLDEKNTAELVAADLSAANLFGCNFRNAKLARVRLECACLDGADLRGADLQNAVFGQSSTLKGHTMEVRHLLFSVDDQALFSCSDDKTIRQWSVETGALVRVFEGHTSGVLSLALSRDGKMLFSASSDKSIRFWSVENGLTLRTLEGHTGFVRSLVLSHDCKTLFSGSDDKSIREWSVETSALVRIFEGHSSWVWSLALSSDDGTLFSASDDKTLRQWSLDTGVVSHVFEGHTSGVKALALSSDDMMLFSGSSDKTIYLWSTDTGVIIRVFQGHTFAVLSLALSSDGKTLFSGSLDKTIRRWSVDTGSLVRTLEGHTKSVSSLALSSNGQILFSGSADSNIRQWSVETGSLVRPFTGHTSSVWSLAVSPDGKILFSGSDDSTIRQWSVDTGSLVRILEGHLSLVRSLVLSPDGKSLFSCSNDKTIRRWSVDTGALIRVIEGHTGYVLCLALSADGQTLFSGSEDHTVRRWAVESGTVTRFYKGHSAWVWSLALSVDGKSVFSGSVDKTIRQWSVDTGTVIRIFKGHTSALRSLALSLDGHTLYSGADDKTIREWPIGALTNLDAVAVRVLEGHTGAVRSLALSTDGTTLYSGSEDKTIRRWSTQSGSFVGFIDSFLFSISTESLVTSSDGSIFFSSGKNIVNCFAQSIVWSSGPWYLSAKDCKVDDKTQISLRLRALLKESGACELNN